MRYGKLGKRRPPPAHGAVASNTAEQAGPTEAERADFLENEGFRWLSVPNVVGISFAEGPSGADGPGELSVRFDVVAKLPSASEIVRAASRPIPKTVKVGDFELRTEVVEAWPERHASASSSRRARVDPVLGGISIGNSRETGTLGAIVHEAATGRTVALSNWHVLVANGTDSSTAQPGPADGLPSGRATLGTVIGAVLDGFVDAAVTSIEHRTGSTEILGLATPVTAVTSPAPGMRVIKSGRTTEVTYGVVKQQQKVIGLPLPDRPLRHKISVCTIERDPTMPQRGPLSSVGDSGACWMLVGGDGRPTGTMVGLHIGGDGSNVAYACHADKVFARLGLKPGLGPSPPSFGARDAPPPPPSRYRVIARDGLMVRGGPGPEFAPLGLLPFGAFVHSLGVEGDWIKVDVEGDGKADGFMLRPLLEPTTT